MLKQTLKFVLTSYLMTLSIISFSQTKDASSEVKIIASNLIESYYILKASAMTNSTECTSQLKEKVSGLNSILKFKVDQNKVLVTQKIGASNLKELQNFIQRTSEYAESNEELTTEKRGSLMVWTNLWKNVIEDIFLKLNK